MNTNSISHVGPPAAGTLDAMLVAALFLAPWAAAAALRIALD